MKSLYVFLVAMALIGLPSLSIAKNDTKKKNTTKKTYQKVPPSEPKSTSPSPVNDMMDQQTVATPPTSTPLTDTTAPTTSNEPLENSTQTSHPATSQNPANDDMSSQSPVKASLDSEKNNDTKTSEAPLEDSYGKAEGILGKLLIGPNVTLLGLPTPFRFGVETKFDNLFGVSFDYGLFPNLTISDVKLKYNSWRVVARIFPFRGGFYLGFGYGKQKFTGASRKETAGTEVNYDLTVDTTILVPQIGWRWTSSSGFFFGMELGVQLASKSSAAFSSDAPQAIQATADYESNKKDIEDQGKLIGQTTLPHMALVQIGWFL